MSHRVLRIAIVVAALFAPAMIVHTIVVHPAIFAGWSHVAQVSSSTERRAGKGTSSGAANIGIARALSNVPLYFIENRGQVDPRVSYYVQGRDTTLYFTDAGITFVETRHDRAEDDQTARIENISVGRETPSHHTASRSIIRLDFLGANPEPAITAADPTPAVTSYFTGRPDEWKTGIPMSRSIVYHDVWPGIDLTYSGTPNRLKYTFLIQAGTDPSKIALAYRGVRDLRVNGDGQLEIDTPAGMRNDDKPYAYQDVDGRRVEVRARYSVDRASHRYGFALGSYDRTRPLVLDPAVLVYAGYIGGNLADAGGGIAVDSSGNAYVAGFANSTQTTFPVTVGPDLTFNGSGLFRGDAFVAKINPAGTALVYCGYIGGSGDDEAYAIAVDSSGNAYVTGYTNSGQATFPVTVGPDLTFNAGTYDAFVAKVNVAGTALDYAGYIGGNGPDYGYAIAVDAAGSAYVTGQTASSAATFPVKVGPDLTPNGSADVFVAKVNAAGTGFDYAGYIGGSFAEYGYGIAVDGSGNAYVTGFTQSDETTFPVTVGPGLHYAGGTYDAFVAKVNPAGSALVYCGFIGGSGDDVGNAIAVDSAGHAYVTGYTASTQATFPVTVGPDLTHNGGVDVFVAKVNVAGAGFDYAGYIGGNGADYGNGIAVDGAGNAYVAGYTGSNQSTFPVTDGPDLTQNGDNDAFVAKINAAGTALLYCGYIGGNNDDRANGIAIDSSGNALITGYTLSNQSTFPVTGGPDLTTNGGQDAFVAKISGGGHAAFTDDPLIAQVTPIKVAHITELRTRIDAVRSRYPLGPYPYTNALNPMTSIIKAQDISELRTALAEAYAFTPFAAPTYTDPVLSNSVAIKATHIAELRQALLKIE